MTVRVGTESRRAYPFGIPGRKLPAQMALGRSFPNRKYLTGTVWSAATLTGHDLKTVKRYVEARNGGRNPYEREPHPKMIDVFLEKFEE